ncbi:MAG: SUMF1/EgtB/PvdO family nonheme iron enzyme [Deltaproteobacteria bacterium]|nr:SUMF1/EgtB/PvdO family nonheme iron enzyme [Deltaproteobacteria bacterium]
MTRHHFDEITFTSLKAFKSKVVPGWLAGLNNRVLTTVSFLVVFVIITGGCSKWQGGAPEGMVAVPAGEFIMGGPAGESDERPERKLILKAFYMDRFEATNESYKRFIDKTGRKEPVDWTVYGYTEERKGHPVVFVSYEDAAAYCKWAGKRLPTDEEWEKAARGTDGRRYPWGNEFDGARANTGTSGVVGTTPAGRYETGKSPYGAYDMAGNVWEWVDSDFDEKTKVVRGGSWGLTHRFARTFFRVGYPPKTTVNNLGFRCARD